jgi:hypothetical protein
MIARLLRKQVFIKSYIELLEHQYSENRQMMAKILQIRHSRDNKDVIGVIGDADKFSKINKLVKEQIYIKRMINTGREMQRDYIKNDLL